MAGSKLLVVLACYLMLVACSSWQQPPPIDESLMRSGSIKLAAEGVSVQARVLSSQECLQMVGADLPASGIQPVWVEIENGSGQELSLLQSGADPEYFSPLEVSWTLHSWGGGANNAAIDAHLQAVAFERGPIAPGETRSGLLFTNPHRNHKLLNIDLLGEHRFIPFTLIVPVPDAEGRMSETSRWRYQPGQMVDYQRESAFRDALRDWYADALPEAATALTEPLSLVWIGRPVDIGAVLVRRGYRLQARERDLEERLSGMPPDYVLRKSGRGAPANWIRLWALPMSFQGRPVLVGQAGAPVGGRFAPALMASETDPALDGVRDLVVQDLLYSGGLVKLAIAHPQPIPGVEDVSDGRVAVLFVAARPLRVDDVRIVDWKDVDWSQEPDPYAHASAGDE